jgi:hypothetical protein
LCVLFSLSSGNVILIHIKFVKLNINIAHKVNFWAYLLVVERKAVGNVFYDFSILRDYLNFTLMVSFVRYIL